MGDLALVLIVVVAAICKYALDAADAADDRALKLERELKRLRRQKEA